MNDGDALGVKLGEARKAEPSRTLPTGRVEFRKAQLPGSGTKEAVAKEAIPSKPIDHAKAAPVKAKAAVVRAQAGAAILRGPMLEESFADQIDEVFRTLRGPAGAQSKLDSSLSLRIGGLERTCHITEAQKDKLRLAGRGDIKRFFDKVEAAGESSSRR